MFNGKVIIGSMNKSKRYARKFAAFVLVCLLAFGGSSAMAASRDRERVPTEPPKIETSRSWVAVVYSVIALAGICVIAFKNPKRTHVD